MDGADGTTTGLTDLAEVAAAELTTAREASAGRAARTLHGGRHHALRQTVVALRDGAALDDHESPGEATLQVLYGRVRLTSPAGDVEAATGDLLVIPPTRHGLLALEDAAVLLTVVKVEAAG
jgi:quercetin dioxygenase-like cupin family protein